MMTEKSRVQCAGSHPGATAGLSLKKARCTPVGPPPKGGAVGVWCSRGSWTISSETLLRKQWLFISL